MGQLPYWDQDVELDIAAWVPYYFSLAPSSLQSVHSSQLRDIADLSLNMDSEFLLLRSLRSGRVGTLFPDHLIRPERGQGLELGFAMVFSYSAAMENLTRMLGEAAGLKVGLTLCGVWNDGILLDECKVIVIASEDPFFDDEPFLGMLQEALHSTGVNGDSTAFFAERLGYRRFSIPYETDDVTDMLMANVINSYELKETLEIVGSAPTVSLTDMWREDEA
ncbi:MAG: hypothetical protein K9L28_10360 [Synergistales bacterium]|nr:hypothetical protein [Synergistales bacterium]